MCRIDINYDQNQKEAELNNQNIKMNMNSNKHKNKNKNKNKNSAMKKDVFFNKDMFHSNLSKIQIYGSEYLIYLI